jgi:hypothetical protein
MRKCGWKAGPDEIIVGIFPLMDNNLYSLH